MDSQQEIISSVRPKHQRRSSSIIIIASPSPSDSSMMLEAVRSTNPAPVHRFPIKFNTVIHPASSLIRYSSNFLRDPMETH